MAEVKNKTGRELMVPNVGTAGPGETLTVNELQAESLCLSPAWERVKIKTPEPETPPADEEEVIHVAD